MTKPGQYCTYKQWGPEICRLTFFVFPSYSDLSVPQMMSSCRDDTKTNLMLILDSSGMSLSVQNAQYLVDPWDVPSHGAVIWNQCFSVLRLHQSSEVQTGIWAAGTSSLLITNNMSSECTNATAKHTKPDWPNWNKRDSPRKLLSKAIDYIAEISEMPSWASVPHYKIRTRPPKRHAKTSKTSFSLQTAQPVHASFTKAAWTFHSWHFCGCRPLQSLNSVSGQRGTVQTQSGTLTMLRCWGVGGHATTPLATHLNLPLILSGSLPQLVHTYTNCIGLHPGKTWACAISENTAYYGDPSKVKGNPRHLHNLCTADKIQIWIPPRHVLLAGDHGHSSLPKCKVQISCYHIKTQSLCFFFCKALHWGPFHLSWINSLSIRYKYKWPKPLKGHWSYS